MTSPLSIRFDPDVLERLRRRASSSPGATPSGLAQRLVDEGLREAEFPGIVFKDGPSRRAALALGPDVWEIVRALREVDERGEAAVDAMGELLTLTPARVRLAMRYYAAFERDITDEIVPPTPKQPGASSSIFSRDARARRAAARRDVLAPGR